MWDWTIGLRESKPACDADEKQTGSVRELGFQFRRRPALVLRHEVLQDPPTYWVGPRIPLVQQWRQSWHRHVTFRWRHDDNAGHLVIRRQRRTVAPSVYKTTRYISYSNTFTSAFTSHDDNSHWSSGLASFRDSMTSVARNYADILLHSLLPTMPTLSEPSRYNETELGWDQAHPWKSCGTLVLASLFLILSLSTISQWLWFQSCAGASTPY